MEKHTAGPWSAEKGEFNNPSLKPHERPFFAIKAPGGHIIAQMSYLNRRGDPEEDANARLIAAAPDFYDACRHGADATRLELLSALLTEIRESNLPQHTDDPEAMWTAFTACEDLLGDLRAACAKAEGRDR